MNTINAILAENPDFKIVAVKFNGGSKTYHYKTYFDVKAEDKVVVLSPNDGLQIVTAIDVLEPMEFNGSYSLKWLVAGAIDVEHYEKLQAMEREVTEKVNQLGLTRL